MESVEDMTPLSSDITSFIFSWPRPCSLKSKDLDVASDHHVHAGMATNGRVGRLAPSSPRILVTTKRRGVDGFLVFKMCLNFTIYHT